MSLYRPFIRIAHNSELEAKEKADMWDLYEENMFDLYVHKNTPSPERNQTKGFRYSNSSFGWKPAKRKKEIFHTLSRFLLIYDSQEETSKMIGFCMFRFENEEGGCVVYWFVSSQTAGLGLLTRLVMIFNFPLNIKDADLGRW